MGVFRTLLPRSHGGMELSVPEVLPLIEALSTADGSVGWVAMIGTASQMFFTRTPRAVFDEVFVDEGRCDRDRGGHAGRPGGTGRWRLSGLRALAVRQRLPECAMDRRSFRRFKDGAPAISRTQAPMTRCPASSGALAHRGDVAGLRTDRQRQPSRQSSIMSSYPRPRALISFHGPSCVPGPLECPTVPFIGNFHAAVAVGIAAGAVADLAAMAGSGRRQLFAATDLRDSAVFQHEFGRLGAELRAARALMQVQAESHWQRAKAGALDDKADFTESLQGSAWIHAACTDVVSGCLYAGRSQRRPQRLTAAAAFARYSRGAATFLRPGAVLRPRRRERAWLSRGQSDFRTLDSWRRIRR